MYAITFELHPINNWADATGKVCAILQDHGFIYQHCDLFVSADATLADVYKLIDQLKREDWLADALRGLKVLVVDRVSDFTHIIKQA